MSDDFERADDLVDAQMLSARDINVLVSSEQTPFITVYVETSPISNYREKNRIRYKDQIKKVGHALDRREMDKYRRSQFIDQLESVGATDLFWAHQQYGLAVFLSPGLFAVRRMMHSPDSVGIVADSFHLRPALFETRTWARYQVLCVDLHEVALYDCNQERATKVDLHSDVPRGIAQALGHTETSVNRKDLNTVGNESADLERYFQAMDEAINSHHNGRTALPLILAIGERTSWAVPKSQPKPESARKRG